MNNRKLATGVLTVVLAVGVISWFLEHFWHYPAPGQSADEPAAGEG